MKTNDRIEYIDMVRGICIIYMILGHIGFPSPYFDHYIHAFHMPMFFLISGILFKADCELGIFEYIKKMIKKVIIPYLFWAFIFLIIDNKTCLGTFFGIRSGLYYIFTTNNVKVPIAGALWFLTSFFFCNSLFYILFRKIRNKTIFGITSISLMIVGISLSKYFNINLWWSLHSALVGLGIYYLGYLLKKELNKVNFNNLVLIVILFLLHVLIILKTSYVNMRTGSYPNVIMFTLNILSSFVVYASISRKLLQMKYLKPLNKFIMILGKESMVSLCLNQFLIVLFGNIYGMFNFNVNLYRILLSVSVIMTLVFISKISKTTKLKKLFGR